MKTKIVWIYSWKWGVWKTTVTALIALNFINNWKKVYVLDMDLNTPSIHKLFSNYNNDNFQYRSTAKEREGMIDMTRWMTTRYINKAIEDINNGKYEYVIVDFPPSISDFHKEFLWKIDMSWVILVTQPTELSYQV